MSAIAAAAAFGLLAACSADADPSSVSADVADGGAQGAAASASPSPSGTTAPVTTAPATTATATPPAAAAAPPKIEKKTVVEIRKIPFKKTRVSDSTLKKGKTVIRTRGVAGTKRLTYEVALTDGVQTGKRLVGQVVSRPPTAQVTAIGTKVESKPSGNCDPNYTGKCVPVATDVDCAGGSGNGPAYVSGPVRVIGSDVYDLDRDSDGVGCDD